MRKFLFLVIVFVLSTPVLASSVSLPFGVKLAGQVAVPEGTVARIAQPVSADSELEAEVKTDMMIINVFISDAKGNVASENSSAAEIIMANGTNKVTLNQTMSKNSLKPGIYLANIVANGQTSRIVFTVK